ncbi:helix-turn-helix domain-containing protein [Marinicella meishanensis]|uniref:helix-turn-helix domain-containing protein n=1 Tax=Marinicella meishanensis TaxID=2873263 RepID=UPI001CBAA79B|nr:helix-turn-helix transcriptional regulator [Marinicella sp. NBU2979]
MLKSIYTKESDTLRAWLKTKRKEKGLSQRKLANQLDIHHSIIGKIETGERQVNVVELIIYCKELDADPIEIIKQLKS